MKRIGRWIDFENDYKTLDPTYMESVWWVFKQLWEKGLVYRGFKVGYHGAFVSKMWTQNALDPFLAAALCDAHPQACLLKPLPTSSLRCMQVMPYSTGLSTPLANFEANQNYKDTVDPSVMVSQSPSYKHRRCLCACPDAAFGACSMIGCPILLEHHRREAPLRRLPSPLTMILRMPALLPGQPRHGKQQRMSYR